MKIKQYHMSQCRLYLDNRRYDFYFLFSIKIDGRETSIIINQELFFNHTITSQIFSDSLDPDIDSIS